MLRNYVEYIVRFLYKFSPAVSVCIHLLKAASSFSIFSCKAMHHYGKEFSYQFPLFDMHFPTHVYARLRLPEN